MNKVVYKGYDSETKELILLTDKPEIVRIKSCTCEEPTPDPEPTTYDLEWDAYMENDGVYTKINERFEVLEGRYEDGIITFHFKSLQDKLSMQGGVLVMEPVNLRSDLNDNLSGTGTLKSPRRSDFPTHIIKVKVAVLHGIFNGLFFTVADQVVQGCAETSAGDHPWNWHYGLEIQGSIPIMS